MTETAEIVKVFGDKAEIKIEKKKECEGCNMCLFPKGEKYSHAVADCPDDGRTLNVGDRVQVEITERGKLLSVILIFLIPLLLVGASVIVGLIVLSSDIAALVIAMATVIIWFCLLKCPIKWTSY